MMQSTIFVVDDDAQMRDLLADIGRMVGLHVETFATPYNFLNSYKDERPGCLVTDIRMPQMSGLELYSRLKEMGIQLPVIFITGHAEVPVVVQAFKSGAVDFIEKPFKHHQIIASIQKAIEMDAVMRRDREARSHMECSLAKLTNRERGILNILITGKPCKHVAQELGISVKTVDFHRANILTKMEANSLLELARQLQ
jgi:two-component system response regulator FixJ